MPRSCLLRSLLLLALALGGCAPRVEQATAIAVSVKTDLLADSELREVSYRVFPARADPDGDAPVAELTTAVQTLDHPFLILKGSADELLLSVEGFFAPQEDPVVVQRVRVRFVEGETLALHVFLARACLYEFCETEGLTCYGEAYGQTAAGECAPIAEAQVLDAVSHRGDESHWQPVSGEVSAAR
jgi:hypothetical protein